MELTRPKRVLHIVSAMNRGGTETLLMNVYRHLDRNKLQFDFIVHQVEKGDYDHEILSMGGNIYRLPSLGQIGFQKYMRRLKQVMTVYNYEAIHSHTDFQSGIPAWAAKSAGIDRRICHAHTNKWPYDKGLKNKGMLTFLQGIIKFFATQYCACSDEAGVFLFGKRALEKGKVKVLNNGISLKDFSPSLIDENSKLKKVLGIPNDHYLLGHVGNFSSNKNQRFIIKVLEQLLKEDKNVTAIFVGDGKIKKEIEQEAKNKGIYEHTRFLGVRSDIPQLMRAFDVFLFPSLYEGFGIVALEAQAAGTPCMASDAVPRTTDMEVGLINYLSLDAPIQEWVQSIQEAFVREKTQSEVIQKAIKEKGYDIQENTKTWLALYGVS